MQARRRDAQHTLNVLNRPRLVWDCFVGADPIWSPLLTHIGYERASDLNFNVGERALGVYKRDWLWLEEKARS
ncbi:MAG: hypothetical protein J2P17_05375 [Mycobacterium sp.]|nr:hypothetical protein [Mycobacterium sp.]